MSPRASNKASKVLAPIRRRWALSFEKAISIGLRVWAVWRQEQEPTAVSFQGFCCARAFVCGQVIEDDNGTGFEFRGQLRFDICVECRAIHGPGDDPRSDQRVLCQPRDECLRSPFAKRCRPIEPFAHRRAAPKAGQVRFRAVSFHVEAYPEFTR